MRLQGNTGQDMVCPVSHTETTVRDTWQGWSVHRASDLSHFTCWDFWDCSEKYWTEYGPLKELADPEDHCDICYTFLDGRQWLSIWGVIVMCDCSEGVKMTWDPSAVEDQYPSNPIPFFPPFMRRISYVWSVHSLGFCYSIVNSGEGRWIVKK